MAEEPVSIAPERTAIPIAMTISDVTGILHLFEQMLLAMESRLVAKMDSNSRAATERWAMHDRDLEVNTKRVIERFEKLEKWIGTLDSALQAHLDKEHDEELVLDARVKPVKTLAQYTSKNWKTILLVAIAVFGALGFAGENLQTLLHGLGLN